MDPSRYAKPKSWLSRPVAITAATVIAFSTSLLGQGIGGATPTTRDIERAKERENYAEQSVAQLEISLAEASQKAEDAAIAAAIAGEEVNQAQLELEEAQKVAKQARKDAKQAEKDFEAGLQEFATIAQLASRNGTSLDTLAPYLQADGLRNMEQQRNIVDSFSEAADNQMQEVAALEQVATVMVGAAESAEESQEKAVQQVEEKLQEVEQLAAQAQEAQSTAQAETDAMTAELAERRQTTVELEEERQAELRRIEEEERQAELRRQAEREAERQAEREAERQAESERLAASEQNTSGGNNSGGSNGSSSGGSSSGGSSSGSSGSGGTSSGASNYKPPASTSGGTDQVIAFAKSKIGAPYVWGGEGPWGYDCSGIVQAAYASIGVYLPHQSQLQYQATKQVPFSQARPGDLVFWQQNGVIYHVAIYLGNNQIIHAAGYHKPLGIDSMYNWDQALPTVGRVL